jgi:hypothetical protein
VEVVIQRLARNTTLLDDRIDARRVAIPQKNAARRIDDRIPNFGCPGHVTDVDANRLASLV